MILLLNGLSYHVAFLEEVLRLLLWMLIALVRVLLIDSTIGALTLDTITFKLIGFNKLRGTT
jgi:hypothetical protein